MPSQRYNLRSRSQTQHTVDELAAAEALLALKSAALADCAVCGKLCEPADDDGHCSYECASGGKASASSDSDGFTSTGTADVGCYGCKTNQPNQLAHIGAGGCLGEWY